MGRIGLITLVYAVLGSCLIESAFAQDTSCPYHLCTAERLGCTDVGLRRDERGCLLCKCQESVVQPRVCPLHGCTVELLGCVGRKLRKSDNGCTLCECEADNSTLAEGTSDPGTALDRNVVLFRCPQITCTAEQLGCQRLAVNQTTNCRMCACAGSGRRNRMEDRFDIDPNEDDRCPQPQLGIRGYGRNLVSRGSRVPKYKLAVAKLKKGFQPGKVYKVQIKSKSPTAFFTKYLVEITETAPRNGGSGDRCGNGYFFTNSSLILSASCPLVASETTSGENKTAVSLKWTAPLCGCLTIRAMVVNSNNIGYRAQPGEAVSTNPGRKSPLHRVVCLKEKRSNARRGKKRNKSKKKKEWIDVDCCRVGNNQQSSVRQMGRLSHECDMRAKLHSVKKYFKLPSKQKSCRKAFKRCCIKNGKAQRRNRPRTRKQRRRRS